MQQIQCYSQMLKPD